MSDEKQVKIIQITAADHIVFGLGEDDKVYIWIQPILKMYLVGKYIVGS